MKRLSVLPGNAGRKRMLILMLLDVMSVWFAYGFALILRFDFAYSHILADSAEHIHNYVHSMPIWCLVTLVVFILFRLLLQDRRLCSQLWEILLPFLKKKETDI